MISGHYLSFVLISSLLKQIYCQGNVGPLSYAEKSLILSAHNDIRRSVFPTASNMKEMRWSAQLEASAQQYANQCVFRHGTGREIGTVWEWVGENLYARRNIRDVARGMSRWIEERRLYDFSSNSCVPNERCGHYTQMVWADSEFVGCGITFCPYLRRSRGDWTDAYNLVCHYGPGGNVLGSRPYIPGQPCSRCPWYMPVCRQGLCSSGR